MISKKDIQDLANLSRIEITNDEAESLTKEVDSILEYVSQIQNVSVSTENEIPKLRNVMRDDEVLHKSKEYTEDILSNAPSREGNYLKVKKILE